VWLNIREFQINGFESAEGIELLQKLGIEASESDLQEAVKLCGGHALALRFLASIISTYKIALNIVLTNPVYSRLWKGKEGDMAKKMLDHIYKNQLSEIQRKLLLAFSIYREPVQFNAVLAIISEYSEVEILSAIRGLLVQHLLQAVDNGYYQLHIIVASYVQDQFDEKFRYEAHERAALYYREQAKIYCPPPNERRRISDVHLLTEAVWQFCQAEQWKQAYNVIDKENLFVTLKRCGANEILLRLLQLLLPLDKWHASPSEAAYVYTYLGDVCRTLGQMPQAHEHLEQAKSICENHISHGITENLPYNWVLSNFGRYYSATSDWKRAQEYFEQVLDVCKMQDKQGNDTSLSSLGDQITTLNDLGGVYQKQRKRKMAIDNYKQALTLSREIGDRGKEATTLKNMGDAYSASKTTRYKKKVLEYYTNALNIQKELGIRGQEALTLSSLGTFYNNLGEKSQALDYFKQALNICREVGDRFGESRILYQVGTLHLENDAYQIALACLLTAHEFFELAGSKEQASVKSSIEELRQKLGQEQFDDLEVQVKQNKRQIIEKEF
jgi:tetratricopeptide (TPR) repeat protein